MYCVCYEGKPVKEVIPDGSDGIRINVAAGLGTEFLKFPTQEVAYCFADFLEEFSIENFINVRKVN